MFFLCLLIDSKDSGTHELLILPSDVFFGLLFGKVRPTDTYVGWKIFFSINCAVLLFLRFFFVKLVPKRVEEAKGREAYESALNTYYSRFGFDSNMQPEEVSSVLLLSCNCFVFV